MINASTQRGGYNYAEIALGRRKFWFEG